MKNESEQQLKRNSVVCPKCGQRTTFNLIMDAIDDEGEFYRCQHCGWPFHYKVAMWYHPGDSSSLKNLKRSLRLCLEKRYARKSTRASSKLFTRSTRSLNYWDKRILFWGSLFESVALQSRWMMHGEWFFFEHELPLIIHNSQRHTLHL